MSALRQGRLTTPDTWLRLADNPRACAAVDERGARCVKGRWHLTGEHDFQFPDPAIHPDHGWMDELTAEQRAALPAVYHRPYYDGLSSPALWCCAVCWGDGWTTQWPCAPAYDGAVELAESLRVGWAR